MTTPKACPTRKAEIICAPSKLAATLEKLQIAKGGHGSRFLGTCVEEAVSYITGEYHSYYPSCVNDQINNMMVILNDSAPSHTARQRLKEFIPLVIATASLPRSVLNQALEYGRFYTIKKLAKRVENKPFKKKMLNWTRESGPIPELLITKPTPHMGAWFNLLQKLPWSTSFTIMRHALLYLDKKYPVTFSQKKVDSTFENPLNIPVKMEG